MRLASTIVALAFVACSSSPVAPGPPAVPPARPAPAPPPPTPPSPPPGPGETGGCNNLEGATATCSEFVVSRVPEPAGQAGTALVRVLVQVTAAGAPQGGVLLHFRVPEDKVAELERLYAGHAPTPCVATIIRPPCNPQGSDVQLPELAPPPWARREAF